VIRLGRGVGYLNVLDPGQAVEVAQLLEDHDRHEAATRVRADAHGPGTDILDRALRVPHLRFDGIPVLKDLLGVIVSARDELRQVALDCGDMNV
jgi:hypothetical protein